ncbi:MAG: hypothetical protein O2981_04955 [Proteobacteria bacterium]|nr:hypothetical protein [Pseudomonadota bacterium]
MLLFLGSGAAIGVIGLWKPLLYRTFPLLSYFMLVWLILVLGLTVYLLVQLSRTDAVTARRRKDRVDTNWQMREESISRGLENRQRVYSREAMLREQKEAERRARQEVVERQGVEVHFKPDRRIDKQI